LRITGGVGAGYDTAGKAAGGGLWGRLDGRLTRNGGLLGLGLGPQQKADLIEYLKSL